MVGILRDKTGDRFDESRQGALHVGRPTAVERPVAHRRREGIGRPLLDRSRGDHVRVAGEAHERRALTASGPQVVHAVGTDTLASKAERGQKLGKHLEAARVVRSHRGTGDQLFRDGHVRLRPNN